MLDHTWILSPTIFNDFRLNYTRGKFSSTVAPEWDPYNGGTKNLNTEFGLPSLLSAGLPSLPYIGGQGSTNNNDVEERYDISDTHADDQRQYELVLRLRRQPRDPERDSALRSLRRRLRFQPNLPDQFQWFDHQRVTGGNAFAGFALGVPFAATYRTVTIPYYYRWNSASGFVQNDWKIRPNLTLNLGLRYSLQLPRTEKYDHQGAFRPDLAQSYNLPTPLTLTDGEVIKSVLVPPFAFAGKGGASRYLYPADYTDFEPRFGFAYSPRFLHDRHITLRGGYGLSHAAHHRLRALAGSRLQRHDEHRGTNRRIPHYVIASRFESAGAQCGHSRPGDLRRHRRAVEWSGYQQQPVLPGQGGGYAVSSNVHTPYSQSWNFDHLLAGEQQQYGGDQLPGQQGHAPVHAAREHQSQGRPLAQRAGCANVNTAGTINDPLGRINPTTGKVMTVQNGSLGSPYLGFSTLTQLYDAAANSIRHAGYVSLVHRARGGLTLSSNYTLGKSIDDASDAGSEKNVATVGRVDGQVALGGTRKGDRSVSLVRSAPRVQHFGDLRPALRPRQEVPESCRLARAIHRWRLDARLDHPDSPAACRRR